MGKEKAGFLTPKAIANRIKSKGLQKLRWYCQMCEKQCRDENGFKCHAMSESHQRQLLLFADNPNKFLDGYSSEFEMEFMKLLSRQFGTKRVQANQVYMEYIKDKNHLHMNATTWHTLTGFVKHLGRDGKCKVDYTEKGWFIQWIDRGPDTIRAQASKSKREKLDLTDEEQQAKFLEKQIKLAKEAKGDEGETEFTELKRDNEEEKVTFNLGAGASRPASSMSSSSSSSSSSNPLEALAGAKRKAKGESDSSDSKKKKPMSAIEEIILEDAQRKQQQERKRANEEAAADDDVPWLLPGIVVKLVTKRLGEKYHKKKAVVREVLEDEYTALIKIIDGGEKMKIDQAHVETVIPAIGRPVMLLRGEHRGREAILTDLKEEEFCCCVRLETGPSKGKTLRSVPYEHLSKLHVAS